MPSQFSRLVLATTYPALLVPVSALLLAQWFTQRIDEFPQYTAAMVHGAAVSTFAVVLFISMLTNAIIVSNRAIDRPLGITRATRFPLWQLIVVVSALAWVVVAVSNPAPISTIEQVLGVAVAVSSIGACFWAVRKDPVSSNARRRRLEYADSL